MLAPIGACVDFWEKMTHWIESPLKEQFSDNCLPKVNEWIADILAIAQRLTSSAPRKYVTQEISAAFASQQAFLHVLDGKSPSKANHVDMSKLSNWTCGNKDCQKKIAQAVVEGYQERQAKKGNASKDPPSIMGLLCKECHQVHADGGDIFLSDGNKKKHFQKKEKDDESSIDKKKAKNKVKNERRKARKAEAKKKKAEEEAAAADDKDDESQGESASDDDVKSASSDSSVSMMKKLNATMEALPGKLAALASANVVKRAVAADVSSDDDVKVEDQQVEMPPVESAASSVVKNLLGAYARSDDSDVSIPVAAAAASAQDQLYVPK